MRSMTFVLATGLFLFSALAQAGTVDRIFDNYQTGDLLIGYDVANNDRTCELEFHARKDGRTLEYHYYPEGIEFGVHMHPSPYKEDYKKALFKPFIYTNGPRLDDLKDLVMNFLGAYDNPELDFTLKVYYDGQYRITHARYIDNYHQTIASDCVFN